LNFPSAVTIRGFRTKTYEWTTFKNFQFEKSNDNGVSWQTVLEGEGENQSNNDEWQEFLFDPVSSNVFRLNMLGNWGDPNLYVKQLELRQEDCYGQYEYEVGYPGNDLLLCLHNRRDTPEECQQLCKNTPRCVGWEWGYDRNGCCPKSVFGRTTVSGNYAAGRVAGNRNACKPARNATAILRLPELRGGRSPLEGNVFIDGRPVCDDAWTWTEGSVVCRQMGLQLSRVTVASHFGILEDDNFGMDDVYCRGSEERLTDCDYDSSNNCDETEAAGVVCRVADSSEHGESELELRGGRNGASGNVYIFGQPVCDDGWNLNAADVVCRQLGFPGALAATNQSAFGEVSSVEFGMDDVVCDGTEETLKQCRYTHENDCADDEGAGVECQEREEETTATFMTTVQPPAYPTGDVLMESCGPAATRQSGRMGVFHLTGHRIRNYPVYRHEDGDQFLFVGPTGAWRVGPNIKSWKGTGLKNPESPTPDTPPVTGWQYWDDSWVDDTCIQLLPTDLVIRSTGNAGVRQSNLMGVYLLTEQRIKSGPVYKLANEEWYMYLGSAGYWIVAPSTRTFKGAGLKFPMKVPSNYLPQGGWQFWMNGWRDDDRLTLDTTGHKLAEATEAPTTVAIDVLPGDIEISSSGPAGRRQYPLMGIYRPTGEVSQGNKVYQKVEDNLFLFVGPLGHWRVGPNVGTYRKTGLKYSLKNTPSLPVRGWQYYDGRWKDDRAIIVRVIGSDDGPQTTDATTTTSTAGTTQQVEVAEVDTNLEEYGEYYQYEELAEDH